MQTLGTELDRTIAGWGPEAAAALKRSRNKDRFRAAVERTWRLRPDVGRFVLMHTNGIYIAKDERPRKGPDRHKDWWVFGMYLDDAMARTEVDAWQSVLLMNLSKRVSPSTSCASSLRNGICASGGCFRNCGRRGRVPAFPATVTGSSTRTRRGPWIS